MRKPWCFYFLLAATGFLGVLSSVLDDNTLSSITTRNTESDEFAFIEGEGGVLHIVLKSSLVQSGSANQYNGESKASPEQRHLDKRLATPEKVCDEQSDHHCTFIPESSKCIQKGTFQVYCAGCFVSSRDKHRTQQKIGKNVCPKGTSCVEVQGVNIWNEDVPQVLCLPVGQTREWTIPTQDGKDTKRCSGGIVNSSGRNVKIEAIVNALSTANDYGIEAKRLDIVLNTKGIDGQDNAYDFSSDLILRPHSSVQGCITTQGDFNQKINGLFGVRFI